MEVIKQRYLIKSSPKKVWDALVNPETIEKWGGGPAVMDGEVGFEFSLWGGDVYGKNIEVEEEKKLVQEWYGGEWEVPSIVSFNLNGDGQTCEVVLEHKNVPKDEIEDIDAGWHDYYLGPLQSFLERSE